jgi:hypothetical protein
MLELNQIESVPLDATFVGPSQVTWWEGPYINDGCEEGVMLRLEWDLCRDHTLKFLELQDLVNANTITLAGEPSHTKYSQVICFWIFGLSYTVFIEPLVICLRSLNGMSQRKAILYP